MRNYDVLIDGFYVLALVALSIGGIPEQCSFEYDLSRFLPFQESEREAGSGWKAGFGLVSREEWLGVESCWVGTGPGVPIDANAMPPPGG